MVTLAAIVATQGSARCEAPPLAVIAKIPLPGSQGRIDHLAFDPGRRRLYVAELGNNSVAIVDVARQRFERRLSGLAEPQGIAFVAETDAVYVATGGDGVLHAFHAADMSAIASVDLGDDADNIRVDAKAGRIYAGVGDGALAALHPRTLARLDEFPLEGHPEGFQLSIPGPLIFVNVPDAREIAVIDRSTGRQVTSWPTGGLRGNFPMAIDDASGVVVSAFRSPAKIVAYRATTGKVVHEAEICADADDVFVDTRRKRLYVICGTGVVDVLECATLERIARISTVEGARTGLFVADEDLLFVAARAAADRDAAVWVLKPND
jgi:DNA-binding beta-propeller fold protein YncE